MLFMFAQLAFIRHDRILRSRGILVGSKYQARSITPIDKAIDAIPYSNTFETSCDSKPYECCWCPKDTSNNNTRMIFEAKLPIIYRAFCANLRRTGQTTVTYYGLSHESTPVQTCCHSTLAKTVIMAILKGCHDSSQMSRSTTKHQDMHDLVGASPNVKCPRLESLRKTKLPPF